MPRHRPPAPYVLVRKTYGGEDYYKLQEDFADVDRQRFDDKELTDFGKELSKNLDMWCDDYIIGEDWWVEKLLEKIKVKPEESIFDFLFEISDGVWDTENISQIWVPNPITIEEGKIPVKKYLNDLVEKEKEKDDEWGM